MKLGEIYLHETDKAIGFDLRSKYHIYICAKDTDVGHTFLFVNKDSKPCDHPITKANYPFFPLPTSYICCTGAVFYTDEQLATFPKEPVGQLSVVDMTALLKAVSASKIMVRWQKGRISTALKAALITPGLRTTFLTQDCFRRLRNARTRRYSDSNVAAVEMTAQMSATSSMVAFPPPLVTPSGAS